MKKLELIIICFGLTIASMSQTASPELITSSGESFNNMTYKVDWSIGECITTSHNAGAYIITQGFHQNSYTITAVNELPDIGIIITVYPNPTSDILWLKIYPSRKSDKTEKTESVSRHYSLTNINGKVMQNKKVLNETEQIDFSNYSAGVYLLLIKQENKIIKSFKIHKK